MDRYERGKVVVEWRLDRIINSGKVKLRLGGSGKIEETDAVCNKSGSRYEN